MWAGGINCGNEFTNWRKQKIPCGDFAGLRYESSRISSRSRSLPAPFQSPDCIRKTFIEGGAACRIRCMGLLKSVGRYLYSRRRVCRRKCRWYAVLAPARIVHMLPALAIQTWPKIYRRTRLFDSSISL